MAASRSYDAIIIGAGQAGGPLSTALATSGRRTVLIEREHVGGTCINEGCTPTKTMVASAGVANSAKRAAEYGIELPGGFHVAMNVVRQRKRDMVELFRSGSEEADLRGGVDLIMGEARLRSARDVRVSLNDGGEADFSSPLIVINSGGRPTVPRIQGLENVPFLTSTSIMELDRVPDHLVVLGGGYVGTEFAQMFSRFGSRVTIVQNGPSLLAREDDDVAHAVDEVLREDGIDVLLNATTDSVQSAGNEAGVSLHVRMDGQERQVSGSHLLVAVGRSPNTEKLNLPAAGVESSPRGYIKVDDHLCTSVEGIYAAGDVAGTPPFTHMSYDDFRVLRTNLIEGGNRTTTNRLLPYTLFIDPQLGRVGVTEKEAASGGQPFRVAKMPMSRVARALETSNTRGFMKVIVNPESQVILGCAILGIEGGEMMAMLEIAMMAELPYPKLQQGIFAHPTLAEGFNGLFESWV